MGAVMEAHSEAVSVIDKDVKYKIWNYITNPSSDSIPMKIRAKNKPDVEYTFNVDYTNISELKGALSAS